MCYAARCLLHGNKFSISAALVEETRYNIYFCNLVNLEMSVGEHIATVIFLGEPGLVQCHLIILFRLFPHCNPLSTGPTSSVTQSSNLFQTISRSRVSVYDIETDIYRNRKFDYRYCAFFLCLCLFRLLHCGISLLSH